MDDLSEKLLMYLGNGLVNEYWSALLKVEFLLQLINFF